MPQRPTESVHEWRARLTTLCNSPDPAVRAAHYAEWEDSLAAVAGADSGPKSTRKIVYRKREKP